MEQQSDYLMTVPTNETQLREMLDKTYQISKQTKENKNRPKFKNLLEIISSEIVILTAIHNIKSNKGSKTPGSDGENMQSDILEKEYPEVIQRIQKQFMHYTPTPVRRKWIPKAGKAEMRPLGIPSIIDRIIQECVRIVIEPILEAQFFNHSYGFRPMRDAHMALERVINIVKNTGYHWIIEGDIAKFFDNVNHTILIKRLWHMGIRDQRILMIIKAMLKAGILNEVKENKLGTPQGGIISPLLANAYLDAFDQWIADEWIDKKTKYPYKNKNYKMKKLKQTNLKPAYLIRYADDWVLVTNSRSNAEKWKMKITKFLQNTLRLKLSEEKTLITNIRKKTIHFLGFDYKIIPGKARRGYIPKTRPNKERLKGKIKEIHTNIRNMRHAPNIEQVIHRINLVNSQIRGLCQYYQAATWVNIDLQKYADNLKTSAYLSIKQHGGKWVISNKVDNLVSVHHRYKKNLPAITFNNLTIGITSLSFVKWTRVWMKRPNETPYTKEGRELYKIRTSKKSILARADELLSLHFSELIGKRLTDSKYNFEYFLNRAYTFNRDSGKCKICGLTVANFDVHIHHIRPNLPIEQVNKVPNLATVHKQCHYLIHSDDNCSDLETGLRSRILRFRKKLGEI